MCLAKLVLLRCIDGVGNSQRRHIAHAQVYHNDFESGTARWIPFVPGPDVDARPGLDLRARFSADSICPAQNSTGPTPRRKRFRRPHFTGARRLRSTPHRFAAPIWRGAVWSQYYRDLQTADFTDARIEGMVPGPLSPSFSYPATDSIDDELQAQEFSFYILGVRLLEREQPAPTEKWTEGWRLRFCAASRFGLAGLDLRNTILVPATSRAATATSTSMVLGFPPCVNTRADRIDVVLAAGECSTGQHKKLQLAYAGVPDCSGWDFSELIPRDRHSRTSTLLGPTSAGQICEK